MCGGLCGVVKFPERRKISRRQDDPKPARGNAGKGVGVKGTRVMAQQGTVKFFNLDKGYGFIKPDDGGRDIFVHVTALERAGLRALAEGQRVSFEIEPDKKGKGPKAVNLQLV